MIGTDGQYLLQVRIADQEDFIAEGNLIKLKIVEYAGGALPKFEMSFDTDVEDIINYLNEGNDIEISYGRTSNDMISSPLVVQRKVLMPKGDAYKNIYINGFLSVLDYMYSPRTLITEPLSGVEAIRQVANKHFSINDVRSITSSDDEQRWIQYNIPDRRFVHEIWNHTDLEDSFPVIGITSEGEFIVKDGKATFANDPDWVFAADDLERPNHILYDIDYAVNSLTGLINAWAGRGRKKKIYDLEGGTESFDEVDAESVAAITQHMARRSELGAKVVEAGLLSDNMHENYWTSHMRNLIHLSLYSSESIILSFQNDFRPVRVLDLANFREPKVRGESGAAESAEAHSGLYLISRVARTYSYRNFSTTVELNRESANALRGDLK